jgi:DNA-binding transcriptional MerR regulator
LLSTGSRAPPAAARTGCAGQAAEVALDLGVDSQVYRRATVDRVHFIRGCARLGLRLVDIADLLAVRDTGVCPYEPAEHLLQRRIADIDAELARLSTLRVELVQMTGALPGQACLNPKPGTWLPDREGGEQPMSINNTCGCDEGCC